MQYVPYARFGNLTLFGNTKNQKTKKEMKLIFIYIQYFLSLCLFVCCDIIENRGPKSRFMYLTLIRNTNTKGLNQFFVIFYRNLWRSNQRKVTLICRYYQEHWSTWKIDLQ